MYFLCVFSSDERDRVQKKTFTKWINQHLLKVRKHVNDLYEDLRDGHNLISLLEVLTGQSLPREKGRMRFHRLQNVQIALDFLKKRQVKLVNIRNDDITDGNPKLTLGLIWTIILHFQISEIHVCGESEDMTAKERLLMWSQQMTEGYVGVRCDNFTTSWRDGRLFNAIIHKYRPDLVDMARVSVETSRSNLEQAFGVAERLGVARLLDPEDVDVQTPDEKSVITYVSTLYDVFPKVPDGVDGINANDVDIKWVEYQNMVNYLSQWLKHNVAVMSDRAFPNNPVELKALYTQYLQFKENEIPLKETEKGKIKHLYKMLEVWIEFGRIQLPQGYHPNDVEKEWGKLIVAMLEREKSLRPEVDRLEMLQQIATRVQRDCVNGEDKLALARAALQSDAKRLESGIQFQNEAETAGHLLECENLLRQQVVDIQILLDGKYYYSDQLVQSLTPGGLGTPGSTFTSILTPGLTPALSPAMTPGGMQPGSVQTYMGGGGVGMAPGDLQHLKQMQIRKPLCKSLLVDPNMTEDEVNINFVQDLINWVEEMQVQLDRGDWGSDLPSVETHLENHKGVHRAIEEFQMSLKEAKLSEIQMTQKRSYSEKLGKLETQYGKLLNCSRERQKNLESLHDFVSRATMELIWLNEKEEEEVAFDWSDRNSNISKKREYHSDLMRELDEKEEVIKSVQDMAENLLQENHPARLTIEAYKAAMQTQWSWILQLCSCVEQHLKDNTVYFEFFNDAKESTDYLKSLQGDIQRKYCCDRTSSVHKLEDHIQESMDEKEQLLQYRSTVAGLVGKAKAIVQLKPRNPDTPIRSSIPVKAICDYRQIEITIYKDDECVLASNSHRAKWKVISPSGNEAMVPSVCFTVPPPNKEAVDQASRIEQLYQNVLALWHHSHIKMKSVVSWHYLMADVRAIRDWNTMLPGEHQQVLINLQSHFEDFLEDSKESEVFTVADCSQLEREVLACKDYYEELLKSAEREEHEESVYNLYISEVRNFRMRLEAQEEHLIRQIRTPLDRDDLEQSVLRITEQEVGRQLAIQTDFIDALQNVDVVNVTLSLWCLCRLKTVSLVVRHSQSAEALVKLYEAKLSEEDAVNSDLKSIDTVQWRSEIDEQREIFHDMEDGLQKARGISERMFKAHNERDFDLDWHKEKADQLEERWNNVHSQIESRLVFSGQLLRDRLKTQEKQPEDSKALAELVNQQKVLVAEMEQKQSRIDECQKYSEQYSSGAKDYELQLLTYRAMVDSQHKSPLKRRRMQNSADAIVQEFMDLRTRYTAVVTSMTQYVKFASETLKRAEGEEKLEDHLKRKNSDVQDLEEHNRTLQMMQHSSVTHSIQTIHAEVEAEVLQQKQELAMVKKTAETEIKTLKGSISIRKLIKTKLLDRETLQKLETGLVTLDEVQASLAQFIGKPTAIAGVYLVSSKKKISFLEAADQGLLAKTYAIEYMEAQAATGCIINPSTGQTLSVQAALESGIVGLNLKDKLMDAEKAATGYVHGSKTLSVYQAMEERIVDRHKGKKIIEAQIATGGLVHPVLGVRVPVNVAVDQSLLNKATLQNLYDPVSNPKGFHNPDSGQKTYYCELLKKCLYDTDGGVYLLPFGEKNLSSFSFSSSHRLSVINSDSEWQENYRSGLISIYELADLILSRMVVVQDANSPVAGLWDVTQKRRVTILQGHQQSLIDRLTALRLLEAQACTGGICDPASGEKAPVTEALRRGLLDETFARQLQQSEQAYYGIIHPQTAKTLSVAQAIQENLFPKDMGLRCLEFQVLTATASFLKDEKSHPKSLTCPKTKRKMSFMDALLKGVYDSHTGLRLLEATKVLSVRPCLYLVLTCYLCPDLVHILIVPTFLDTIVIRSYKCKQTRSGQAQDEGHMLMAGINRASETLYWRLQCGVRNYAQTMPSTEFQTIEGILKVGSVDVYSLFSSVQSGMIDHTTGLSLLEAQLITSGLVLPQFRMCLELDEAFHHNLIDEATCKQLRELNEANRSILSPPFSSEPLPVIAALREGAVSERLAMKVIEIQLATGGLRVSYTGDVLTLERAFQFGLIPAPLYVKLLERQNTWKDLINPGTSEKVSLAQLVQRSVVDEETGLRLLPVKKSHNGNIELTSGREMSVLSAVHEGLIDRETTLRLLCAQLFAGGIAEPRTGRKLTVEQSLSEGLIDQDTASGILSQQAQNGGIVNPQNGKRLTVDEAVQCDLMSFSSALLVLEKQKGLMGLLWPHSGEILTISTSLRHEIITSQLAFKLLSNRQKIASLYIPEYSEVVDINSATQNGFIDVHTAEVLKTIEIPDIFPDIISSTKKFLDENRSKLTPDQIVAIESKLEDAKSKVKLINQRAEESRKDLEKSVTTAIKQETEKVGKHIAHHQEILSQQQELIMATQSAQALLDHQAHALSPTDKDKLQRNIQELKGRYDASLTQAEQQMKQVVQVQEELKKFQGDCEEFEGWLQQAEGEVEELGAPAGALNDLTEKLQRQKSFSEDVISHKGDLRFITISGQKVLDVAKACGRMDPGGKDAHLEVDTTTTCAAVKEKLDSAAGRFKALHSQCNDLGNNLRDVVDKYKKYEDSTAGLLKWLNNSEEEARRQQSEAIAADPQTLQKQIYSSIVSLFQALEQDIYSRQSSISAMKAKVKKFVETADPTAAALLQSKMDALSQRFSDACDKHKHKQGQLEQLKDKVEEFEKTMEKVQQFVLKRSQALSETDGPGKNVNELSQLMQVASHQICLILSTCFQQNIFSKRIYVHLKGCAKFKLQGCFVLTDVCSSDAAWADVSGSVEDRKQRLEESNRNLDMFQTTEPLLRQWLSEKDMMLSVLGPLSMDPNMLNTQKQQVQILLNEFDSRKPQFDQLHEAAAAILSTSGKQDPSSGGKVVKDQLAAVTQKWQGLTGQLGQRAGLIDQAVGKSGQFQDLLMSLSQSAASLETQLNSQQALSSQPDVVKKQLEEANTISGQLREERKRLKEAETLCSELSALVTEDYLKAGLDRQLEGVNKPFKQLEDKAAKRIQQLNSAFASSQQFHQTSKDFQGWMNEKLQEQSKPQTISAQVENLRQSLKEQSALQKALSEHEKPYSTIVREGETLLQNTDGAEKVAMQGQLAALRSNWDDVKKSSAERQDKLQGALQRAQKYHEQAEKLQSWVQECEVREGSVRLSVDPVEVESSVSQLKAIQKDVDKHRGLVEQLNTAADSLLEVANADTEAIRVEKAAIGQSVDRVTEGVQNKRESLEKISQRLKEFNDTHNEAKGQLAGAKKQLDAHTSLGVQAYSNKNLTNMKAQQKSLDGVNTQVEHLKSLAQGLVADVPEADGVTDLLLQADSLEKEHGSLSKDVGETCSTLEGKLQGIGQFQTNIREMFTHFADLDDELDSMASVGRDLITLKEQQDGIKGFVEKLQELMADTARGGDSCKKMLETEASPDLLGLKRDLDALSKQCGKLMDRAKGRGEEVGSTLTRLDELYSKLQQFTNKLGGAEVKEEGQGSVGMETDVINQQLEAFKVFQKEVDPLQSQLQDINWLGQGLIQNADKGTSTKGLEHDLEDVNTQWNTLNKKIAERSAQLHEALLHCGRFQDALESLLSWLTDTEDLVSNQKPPSAEFKVVKAQIQEQILLQRLLDDRRPTVELIKKEGGKVAELGAESVDKEKVGKEIECLGQRWDALLKKAENRHKQLKSILVVAQQFHETLEPLSEWLSATEKHLAKAEPIGTQTSKLEEQISQHKVLEEEIMGHSKELVQAVSLGQMLKIVSSVDDKELVQSKLDSSQASYVELQEHCRRKAEMLQQALANAQLFGEDEVALMNWLNEVHTRLSEVSVKDYKTDVLEKQCAEQLALHEDIELRKQNVDQAISNGLELLKQTTGDEVVVIQGKLDGIKMRYAEINSMSDNVSKTLDQALTLASKLQHTHEDLSSWLKNVEAELTAFTAQEPVGEQLVQAQDRQKALLKEARDHKPQVDKLNEVSSSLLELVPWRAREGLDKIVTEDNDRYKATSDTIAHHVEQIDAAILKSQQFEQAADSELAWLTDAERKMLSLGEIRLEQDQTTVQLHAQKGFSMDIMRHKDAVDGIVKTGQAKIQALLEKYVVVSQLNSERCLQLERAQSLASQFWETYEELWPWLQETRTSFSQLPLASIEYEALRQQQEELRQMRELIAEHKPYIDKMNKTGPQLLELSPVAGVAIREKYTATDQLYAQLKADVKQRAFTLDEAISKSTQFHDKIEPMLESLERIAERLRQPPSISVEVEKIREQITENKVVSADLEKLQPSYDTLKQRGEEMIARSAGADKDISAKAVQDKLDRMVFTWNEIHALMEEREAKLLDVMDLADKFWCDHCALIVTIKDTQDLLRELEEPGVDPSVVKQQQEYLESFKEEIDGLQEELDVVRNLGAELMAACGEPDKPVTKKSIDEVNLAWETLNKAWKERVDRLDEAMQAAVQFQDGLQGMFDWVDIVEHKLGSMSPVGTDLDTVKQQIEELKEFKGEAYQLQMEMERLNHQAGLLLKKVTEEYDRCAIQEPMTELKMLWDNLDEKIINRQHKLEGALLALGQFQHALDELLAWMSNTEELLNEQRKAVGDPKAIEIKLAKHHVLQNDVLAHKTTVEAVNKAGTDLVESTSGEEAAGLQNKLENLTQRWKNILEKTEQRRQQLDSALLQAQGFHGEIEDMQQWLKDTERQLLASKAVGGLPDTAREQLNAHLELCSTMEAKEELYQQLMNKGQQLLTMTPSGQDSNTEQDLRNLQDKWESVQAKVAERKVKLEEALALATEFHNSLQDFINWLTQAEQTLTMSSPASLILETILFQIDEHKVFVTEVNSHRQQIIELDKTGTHLKYFSQKQDVVLIKNLLISVQGRWEKVVQRSVERGRLLDDTRKRAKQFHETWNKLTEWLDDSEKALDSELEIANDPDKIKTQLAQHKEFQKVLGSKHSVYDTTSRTGRALKDKTSLQDDNQKLDDMLSELRDKWDTVCGKSVERQNKLEEALLFSGQFTDALQALIDWLYRVEPQLAEDQPVHGDIDLVLNLIDSHKVNIGNICTIDLHCPAAEQYPWSSTLGALASKSRNEFMKKQEEKRVGLNKATSMGEAILTICHPDSITTIKHWNTIIKARFEEVQAWARQHQQRLAMALSDLLATKELLEGLLSWLQWAETTLNDKDMEVLPQEIDQVKALIAEHQTFMEEMTRKQPDVDKITKTHKRKAAVGSEPASQSHIPVLEKGRGGRKRSPTQAMYPSSSQPPIETKNPRVNLLVSKWQQVWLLALDRRRKLNDAMDRLEELKEFANFDFDVWRKRYMRWMNHKKSRVMDFFRRIDKDQDGKVTRQEFIEGILSSKFPTSRLEMSAVADIFDRDGDGYIDYYEFVAALHPNKEAYKPLTDADKIEDEVTRQVAKCKCPKRFQVEQIGANKYRFYLGNQFGDSQQLRLVRILRSTVMVRVGGGWMALDEFLVKNDPCRAKGRTNMELREKFILPEGTTQVMASFRYRGRRSRPSSRAASPNRSNSNHSCPPQQNNPGLTSTPKSIPIQGSKLRLPGYLSGKGFQSGEEQGTLINALTGIFCSPESRRPGSRPGSKAGSRGSSRRGSDASDFDISDIASVCSDTSEMVGDTSRATPRSSSRQHGGKPSKIPTPQRRSTPSKLAKTSKR
uniref:Dystonin n=1 Tax=Hucho hucho TaxID=62062 RepID=A0A4W5PSY5_9TELE